MNSGSIKLPHKCPKCGKTANSHQELEEKFGFRNMGNGTLRAQSQCKSCRQAKQYNGTTIITTNLY